MRRILSFIILSLLLLAACFAAYSFAQWGQSSVAADQDMVIAPGTGKLGVLQQLHDAQLLPEPWKIVLPIVFDGHLHKLKAGEYLFTSGMTPGQVLAMIAAGKVVVHKVTVPEGYTVAEVRALLAREPLLTGGLPTNIAEGSLFPDTWLFQRGDTRASVLARMQARMQHELAVTWETRDDGLPFTTPQEALTMASIVEEETGVASERPMVARVYINRLLKPMRLQSDPTVAYGLGIPGRQLSRNDLLRDGPYNTYTRDGLPPGPICNPGRAALLAVMHPAQSDALYFVATGSGGHNFASTLDEHEANVAAYRKVEKASMPSAPIAPAPTRKRVHNGKK